jgi:membrane-associated phospholipid phosphatase
MMTTPRARFWTAISILSAIWLGCLILGGRTFTPDLAIYHALYVDGGSFLARNAIVFTSFGEGLVLSALAILAAAYLTLHRKQRAALLLIMVFGGRFLVELQKILSFRPRPGVSPHLVAVETYSFPSGHAANSMITYLAIALLVPVAQRNRAIAIGLGLAMALQIGISRVMLGVHWPTDVLGGWAFGLLWIMTCMRLASARPGAETSKPPR